MQRMSRTAHVPQLTAMGHISDTRERNSNADHCSVLPLFITSCHVCHSYRSISIVGLLACFASSVLCSMVIRARGGVRGHGIRQRLQVSQQHLKDKKVSSCRLGRFAMEMCCSGRFIAADLSARVSAGPTSEPTLHRLACAVDVGTRVRKEKREQHHQHTARNTTRVFAEQCKRPALVRRKRPSVERSREPPDIFGRFFFVASRNAATRST